MSADKFLILWRVWKSTKKPSIRKLQLAEAQGEKEKEMNQFLLHQKEGE